jgi:hypothetical protein
MAFQFKLDTEAATQNGSGNGKLKSGVHDVIIKGIFLGATNGGNNTIDIVLETKQGQKAVIFGMCIDEMWKSGSKNVKYAAWQELALISGIKEGKLAKQARKMNGKDEMHDAFIEATGKEVKMAIQEHFDAYNNEVKDSYVLVQTFGKEGHTVSEKMQNKPATRIEGFEVTPWYTPAYKAAEEAGTLKKSSGTAEKKEGGAQADETVAQETSKNATEDAPLF